jgi:hypothetical protein
MVPVLGTAFGGTGWYQDSTTKNVAYCSVTKGADGEGAWDLVHGPYAMNEIKVRALQKKGEFETKQQRALGLEDWPFNYYNMNSSVFGIFRTVFFLAIRWLRLKTNFLTFDRI